MSRTIKFLSLLAGLLLPRWVDAPVWLWLTLFCCFTLFALWNHLRKAETFLGFSSKNAAVILISAAFFCFGGLRAAIQVLPKPAGHIAQFADTQVTFTAMVDQPQVQTMKRQRLHVTLLDEGAVGEPNAGIVLVVSTRTPFEPYRYGDVLRISGKLTTISRSSPNSYGEYLARFGITGIFYNPEVRLVRRDGGNPIYRLVYRVRALCLEKIYKTYPSPENALMAGILLGDESRIPSQLDEDFRRTGTAHIVAISGMNFSVLVWMLLALLRLFPNRWWKPLTLLPFIVFYTIITGAKPAILRAAIMCSLVLVGKSIGRSKDGIDSLLISAALMALQNPQVLLDVGFQLSIFATLGIFLFNDPLAGVVGKLIDRTALKSRRKTVLKLVNELIITSVSAQIFTFWIIASAFHQIAYGSLLVNLLIAPFQSFLMIGGVASMLLAMLFEPLGQLAAVVVNLAPFCTIRIVRFFSQFKWVSGYSSLSLAATWLVIPTILYLWLNRVGLVQRKRSTWIHTGLILLTAATLAVWWVGIDRLDDDLHVRLESVSGRQTIFIRTPERDQILIADGLTNFAAQDLLKVGWLGTVQTRVAFLNFEANWMASTFKRTAKTLPELIFVNVERYTPGDLLLQEPYRLNEGYRLRLGSVEVTLALQFLKTRSWVVSMDSVNILIPNGNSWARFEKKQLTHLLQNASVVLLGRADNRSDWESAIQSQFCGGGNCVLAPELISDPEGLTVEITLAERKQPDVFQPN